jgi:hypothetical protein
LPSPTTLLPIGAPAMYLAYTYLIRNKITNQFYYGSRFHHISKHRIPEDDLWKHYFTTSKYIRDDIKIYGKDSFHYEIIMKNMDYDICYWYEQQLIKENIGNPLCMNKHYTDKDSGHRKFSVAGTTHSEESKRKMSIAKEGKSLPRKPGVTEKIVQTRKKNNVRPSEEAKKKQSASMTGKTPWNKGKIATDEAKKNQSTSHKNIPWSQARRDAQNKKRLLELRTIFQKVLNPTR